MYRFGRGQHHFSAFGIGVRSTNLPIQWGTPPFFRFRHCCPIYQCTDPMGSDTFLPLSVLLLDLLIYRFGGGHTRVHRWGDTGNQRLRRVLDFFMEKPHGTIAVVLLSAAAADTRSYPPDSNALKISTCCGTTAPHCSWLADGSVRRSR